MTLRLHLPAALLSLVALGGSARAHDLSLSLQHRSGGTSFGISIGNGSFHASCAEPRAKELDGASPGGPSEQCAPRAPFVFRRAD